jgi:hypothetical protein
MEDFGRSFDEESVEILRDVAMESEVECGSRSCIAAKVVPYKKELIRLYAYN